MTHESVSAAVRYNELTLLTDESIYFERSALTFSALVMSQPSFDSLVW